MMPIIFWIFLGCFLSLAISGFMVMKVRGSNLANADLIMLMIIFVFIAASLTLAITGITGLVYGRTMDWL